ncbi:hypothetical protein ACVW0J_000357 [Bradyrhizobium sp. i1.7.7]
MRVGVQAAAAVIVGSAVATILFFGSLRDSNAQSNTRYLPEYTADGQLLLPKNFHEWVYVGSPLTPNALNGGQANFPEFHNVYIEPGSYAIYKKTSEFPEGTILFKELQLTLPQEKRRRLANGSVGTGLLPGQVERRRRDRQGFEALRRHQRVGLFQLQSPRTEGADGQGEVEGRVRLLPYRQRQEG